MGENNIIPVDTLPSAKTELVKKYVKGYDYAEEMQFVNNYQLYDEGWDTLPQSVFWKKIIQLSPDSSIVNVAATRTPVETVVTKNWASQTEAQKDLCKAWICQMNSLDSGTCLFVSIGRKDFFEHRKTLKSIDKAIKVFKQNDVDPWYAQTILLIESPGKTSQQSWAGARGPFQLMPAVAKKFGLKVNRYVDERQSLERSAYAASQLLGKIFIPKVKELLEQRNLVYDENALWFRLLVMHTYHAGPGNVAAVLDAICPSEGNMQLIRKMWVTEARGFKNESQNYSQIALAALLNFNDIIGSGDTVNLVFGDVAYNKINSNKMANSDSVLVAYTRCMLEYENDFIDGVIPYDYFISRVNTLKNDMAAAKLAKTQDNNPIAILYPVDEMHYINLSKLLLRKRQKDDAINLLKYNTSLFPESALATESLNEAYKTSTAPKPAVKPKKKSNGGTHAKSRAKS